MTFRLTSGEVRDIVTFVSCLSFHWTVCATGGLMHVPRSYPPRSPTNPVQSASYSDRSCSFCSAIVSTAPSARYVPRRVCWQMVADVAEHAMLHQGLGGRTVEVLLHHVLVCHQTSTKAGVRHSC